MEVTQWSLYFFLERDIRRSRPRRSLGNKELSVLSEHELNVASKVAALDKCKTLLLGQIYKDYRALDQDIRSLLSDADQILKSVSQLVPAGAYTKAKSAVMGLKGKASNHDMVIKELLKVVSMDDGQALRQLNEISSRW